MKFQRLLTISTALILITSGSAFASSFEEYVQRLGEHPQVESILAKSEASKAQAEGELGLPDPMVMIGVDNVPISDPAFDRFLPTSKVIGFNQKIPNPALRGAKSEKLEQMSEKQKLMADYTNARLRFMLISKLAAYESVKTQKKLIKTQLGHYHELEDTFKGQIESGRAVYQRFSEVDVERAEAERKLVAGEIEQDRFTYRRLLDDEEGNAVYIEADCALVRKPDGEPDGIIVSARDVTERVSLETQLVGARRVAENAAAAKSQFLANMSHEIRTPMNGVLGFAQLLQQGDLDPEQRRHVDLIVESGEVMMHLLNDILDISKIEAGQMAVVEEPVRVHELLEGCRKLHSANAERNGIALVLAIDDDVPACLLGDAMRFRQVVLNLVGNAVKFTHVGEVRIHAGCAGDTFEVSVEDSGVGIAPERIEAIFKPFEQADGATSRRFGGSGLGLTISRQLAGLMGGELTADSEVGQGSRFVLRLPLRPVEQEWVAREDEVDGSPPMLPSARILLAEDHDINRMLVTAMLERCGQQVEVAEDGDKAVRMVEAAAQERRGYDLVLMDVQMPQCDGYEATRRIRAAGFGAASLPIVALTANAYEDDVREATEAGMQAHLAKPLAFGDLVAALHRWLPRGNGDNQAGADARPEAPARAEQASSDDYPADLQQRWQERRAEALAAVARILEKDGPNPDELEEIGGLMHMLAGTAAMFDEAALGEAARALENSLRSNPDPLALRETAQRLLRAA